MSTQNSERKLSNFGAITKHKTYDDDGGQKIFDDLHLPEAKIPSNRPLPKDYLAELFTVQMGFNPDLVSQEKSSDLYFKDGQQYSFHNKSELAIFTKLAQEWNILPADAKVTGATVAVKGSNVQELPTSSGESHGLVTNYTFELTVSFALDHKDFPLLKEGTKRYQDSHRPKNPALRLLVLAAEKFNIPWLYDSRVKIEAFDNMENAVEMTLHYYLHPPRKGAADFTHRGSLFNIKAHTATSTRNDSDSYVRSMTDHWDETPKNEAFKERLIEEVHSNAGVWEDWNKHIMNIRKNKLNRNVDESSLNWITQLVQLIAERKRDIGGQGKAIQSQELGSSK